MFSKAQEVIIDCGDIGFISYVALYYKPYIYV